MERTDIAIIGAGPIGIEVASACRRLGLDYLHFEAGQIGATIYRYPRNTRFFSSPERLAVAGVPLQSVDQELPSGERYLAYLRGVVELLDLPIRTYEEVTDLRKEGGRFLLSTRSPDGEAQISARRVVLATGDMRFARTLGIPGEDLPHVSHFFVDPHPYFRRRLLVVGGRNTALEAALRCFRAGADVSISYRKPAFEKEHTNSRLHLEISILTSKGKIRCHPETLPLEITPREVLLGPTGARSGDAAFRVPADFVLLATGFSSDMHLFRSVGAALETPGDIPVFDEDTMETDVPGLYVAGTAAGGDQPGHRFFIATSHDHTVKIIRSLTGTTIEEVGTVTGRRYSFTRKDIEEPGKPPVSADPAGNGGIRAEAQMPDSAKGEY